MDAATRRLLIAQKSAIQQQADTRPRCQDCGRVLVRADYLTYWDGQDPGRDWPRARNAKTAQEYRDAITPRCCAGCAECNEITI